jgi:hypothetical protein
MKKKLWKLFSVLSALLHGIRNWWSGGLLNARLQDEGSKEHGDAERAVARVIHATGIHPKHVFATVIHGGPTIVLSYRKSQEGFTHKTYADAADKAIEWYNKRGGRAILKHIPKAPKSLQRRAGRMR